MLMDMSKCFLVNAFLMSSFVYVNSQWSSWTQEKRKLCQPECRRLVQFRRKCLNRKPSARCAGTDNKYLIEDCEDDLCTKVDGQWTEWNRQTVGLCLETCRRHIILIRACADPRPGRIGQECPGDNRAEFWEDCLKGKCPKVNGQWSAWARFSVLPCEVNCKRGVSLRRTCTNPKPAAGGRGCPGSREIVISEDCDDFLCKKVDGHWSAWSRFQSGMCFKTCFRNIVFKRTCTGPHYYHGDDLKCTGEYRRVITELCSGGRCLKVHGRWTSWLRTYTAPCELTCKRAVTFKRTCTNPRPKLGGRDCPGMDNKHIMEECRGKLCKITKIEGVYVEWATWIRLANGSCFSTCRRTVLLTRSCTKVVAFVSKGQSCQGHFRMEIKEACTGGSCLVPVRKPGGKWSSWDRASAGPCLAACTRRVVLTRTCLSRTVACEGDTTMEMFEDCIEGICLNVYVVAKWSSWRRLQTVEVCPSVCHRVIYLIRVCMNNSDTQIHQCPGRNTRVLTENCVGGRCADNDTGATSALCADCTKPRINTIALAVVFGIVITGVIVFFVIYHRICAHQSPLHHNINW